ncbi:MAG TPA: ATP-binding protein, partial [Candidatus Polarisedimenticolaceae bacterium]|nr:ATP-binding protein [Candidatus Polarisedimenticolaceae bacterium]
HPVLAVEDTGVGVPADSVEKVFHRFYRVDKARSREAGGTGLGLAIVKHLMRLHGGAVRLRSELGKGSRFELEFPAPSGPSAS